MKEQVAEWGLLEQVKTDLPACATYLAWIIRIKTLGNDSSSVTVTLTGVNFWGRKISFNTFY